MAGDESVEVEVNPADNTARAKAYRIRQKLRRGQDVTPSEAEFLAAFDGAKKTGQNAFGKASRVVHVEEHEVGAEGDAAAIAAANAAPALAREEGRRLDYLMEIVLKQAAQQAAMYERVMGQILKRNETMENAHIGMLTAQTAMLEAVREHYLARIDAEASLATLEAQKEAEEDKKKDGIDSAAEEIIKQVLPGMIQKNLG